MTTFADFITKFDEIFGSSSRPAIAVACGFAVAGACFIPASAPIAIPTAGGIVAAYMASRSVDKNTAAKVTIATGQPTAEVKP